LTRIVHSIFSLSALIFFALLAFPAMNGFSQESKDSNRIASEKPIVIHSDTLEFDQEKGIIVFEGNVKARSEGMVVDCQRMIVYYYDNPTKNESSLESGRIDKIIALGDVVITRSDGGMARAGKAVFYQNEEKVELTENPSVQQGPDLVEGHRIVMFLSENRSIIEGNASTRVKATIFPKEEKGK
jgi:lipopolysaccharide export system protein LptA